MYTSVANRLAIKGSAGTIVDYSSPVDMGGDNAARLDAVIFNFAGTNIKLLLQGSNDMQNWEDLTATPVALAAPGYYREALESDIAFAYVRIEYSLTTSGASYCILDAGVYTFSK